MSQITRTGGGSGPTPGDAVLTLSGDGGLDVSPNLAGNIDIDGAGGITVTSNPLTNSLTITGSGGAALTFDGDTGAGTTPAANTITFNGAANQITVASPGTGAGHLTVAMTPSIVVANNITATSGDLSIHGNGTFGGGLLVTAVSAFYDAVGIGFTGGTGLVVYNGNIVLSAPGHLFLGGLTNGALVIDGSNKVTAASGTAGQVLTANGAAVPTFETLVLPAAVTVAGTVNQIAVTAGPNYQVSLSNAVTAPGSLTTTGALTSNTTLTTTGINTLNNLAVNGVVQTDAAHQLVASNGANGAVLIGAGVGNAPVWNTITAGNGITVTNTAGNITVGNRISSTGFSATMGSIQYSATGDGTPFKMVPQTVLMNSGAYYSIITGAYTVPTTGTYYINVNVTLLNIQPQHVIGQVQIYINNAYSTKLINFSPYGCGNSGSSLEISGGIALNFTATQQVTFIALVAGTPPSKVINIDANTNITMWPMF